MFKVGFAGVTAIDASEGAAPVTVSNNDVVWEIAPPAPAIVMVALPTVADAFAVTVNVDDPVPDGNVGGAIWVLTPEGLPVAESDTAETKPPTAVELTVSVALDPRGNVMLVGVTDSTKSGIGTPLTVYVAVVELRYE